ncbi:hypothetical protein HZS_4229, partial [Henneguya salminicola]
CSESVYKGEKFTLKVEFKENYPYTAPIVIFTGKVIPTHPHIYSNGHICMSLLDRDWTPAYSVWSICISILSMLNSCKKKERPADNDLYVSRGQQDPTQTKWSFHDDDI